VPRTIWLALFGHSAWEYDATSGQYYTISSIRKQPDLNWRNPEVENGKCSTRRSGGIGARRRFRLDAVDTLFEDSQLRDNPVLPGNEPLRRSEHAEREQPETRPEHDILQELRAQADVMVRC